MAARMIFASAVPSWRGRLVEAIVAIAARLRLLSEIVQQNLAAAAGRLAIADQGAEPAMGAPLVLRRCILAINEKPPHADIAKSEQHMRLRRLTVAPCPADFLVIGFQIARQIGVKDIRDIRLVDPHAERDGRHHHNARLGHEAVLVGVARLLGHAGMIGQRPYAVAVEEGGGLFRLFARQAIDDAAATRVLPHEIQQCWRCRRCALRR